jgi:hypothetical protein
MLGFTPVSGSAISTNALPAPPIPNIRVSQAVGEVLRMGGNIRVSQAAMEILGANAFGNIRASQAVGEILMQRASVRMSQCAMEILVSTANQIPGNVAVFVMA